MWIIGMHVFITILSSLQCSSVGHLACAGLLLMTVCLFKQEHAILSKLNFLLFLIFFLIEIDKAHRKMNICL